MKRFHGAKSGEYDDSSKIFFFALAKESLYRKCRVGRRIVIHNTLVASTNVPELGRYNACSTVCYGGTHSKWANGFTSKEQISTNFTLVFKFALLLFRKLVFRFWLTLRDPRLPQRQKFGCWSPGFMRRVILEVLSNVSRNLLPLSSG